MNYEELEFPLTKYKYYLFEISDSTISPSIFWRQVMMRQTTQGLYSEITGSFTLATETRNKQTFLKFRLRSPQIIDKLWIEYERSSFLSTALA